MLFAVVISRGETCLFCRTGGRAGCFRADVGGSACRMGSGCKLLPVNRKAGLYTELSTGNGDKLSGAGCGIGRQGHGRQEAGVVAVAAGFAVSG